MKLTTFLLIIGLVQASAASFGQVKLSKKNASLESVFNDLKKQTGYSFFFNRQDIRDIKVSLTINDETLTNTLDRCLNGLPLGYDIKDKTVFISKKLSAPNEKVKAEVSTIDVHGRVVDEKGQPLPGVTVKLKDENQVTTTDKDGNFTLRKVGEKSVIVISFIGYLTKEINAYADLGTISLEVSNSKLDEVQIIAYGTTTRRFTTSNINTVKGEDIAKQPVDNLLLALTGRVPGLIISQTTGAPGGDINVLLQGQNSINNGNTPFFVVDGLPYTPQNLYSPTIGSQNPTASQSNFNYINPSDIESIEILKDADATAIYGSRAANGAILITTKKGKVGPTKVDLNMQTGWGQVTRKLDLMNTQQYLDMRRDALKNSNTDIGDSDYDLNGTWDPNRYTDWQKVLVGGTAIFRNLQASISGGNSNTQFLTSASYNSQSTVYPGDFGDTKKNIHFSINHTSTNQKLHFNLTGSYLEDHNVLSTTDLMGAAILLAPNAPALYNSDGTLNWGPVPSQPGTYSFDNPLAYLNTKYNGKTNNLIGNSLISYEILSGLVIKSTFGINRLNTNEININPNSAVRPDNIYPNSRFANYGNKYINSWIVEPQIAFNKNVLGGYFDAILGGTFQETDSYMRAYNGSGFTGDSQLENILAAPTISATGALQSTYNYNALFGRINYRYNDRYILNLTARRDGSSRFGSQNLFNNFYSVGGAWLFGEESFIKKSVPFINYGKLRLTYGTTGNDQIGDYGFYSLYNQFRTQVPYQGIVGLVAAGHSNPFLQWEETRKLNIGLDLSFFNNKLQFTSNYFRTRSSNQLINYPTALITGFGGVRKNLPATVQNTGLELQLDATPVKASSFKWSTSFNITIPRNKLISYPDLAQSAYYNTYLIGKPVNIVRVYNYAGVNVETGLYEFFDVNGNRTSNPNDVTDKTGYVDINPRYYGGFNNSFSYHQFTLDFLLQFVKQKGSNFRFGNFPPGGFNTNEPANLSTRWQNVGDAAKIQKASLDFGEFLTPYFAAVQSTAGFSDASFIRLKNVQISYSIPVRLINRINISQARMYIQAQNLLTFTNYVGADPETQSVGSLPPLRVISLGIQLTF